MKIYYRRKYPTGNFLNEDIAFEVEVPDDCEDPVAEVVTLKELCDKAHNTLNPNLYEHMGTVVVPVEDKQAGAEIDKAFQETKQRIMEAKTKASAGQILLDSGFKLNLELKTLVNLKPE